MQDKKDLEKMKKINMNSDRWPRILFFCSLCIILFLYGFSSYRYKWFPYSFLSKFLSEAEKGKNKIMYPKKDGREFQYRRTDETDRITTYDMNAAFNNPTMITSVSAKDSLCVEIIDMDGTTIHKWNIDWFRIWPDASHIPKRDMPRSRPGTHIHGAVLLDCGDLVFNFEHLGMVRLDVCGNVVWRLPYRTHHSIYKDEFGNLWVPGQRDHETKLAGYPNYRPPFTEPVVLKVSREGKILKEISIMDLLMKNDLPGLLYMSTKNNETTIVTGNTLHLNDVEPFPSSMKEGVFQAGDIMVSLRNINTILIFSETNERIKCISTGKYVRQHDPDFIDGNMISVFDNNNVAPEDYGHQSRIVIQSFTDHRTFVFYTGNDKNRFYTHIMGKHQWLPNGNLLIAESMNGRAFEIDKKGRIVWEFVNIVEKGYTGILEEAERLPGKYNRDFFARKTDACRHARLNE